MKDPTKLIKQRISRMCQNRKRRNSMKRLYVSIHGSQTGYHVSVYNIMAFVKRHDIKPPFQFELSPINYHKEWRNYQCQD